jgi:ankyrin repeat protein
MKMRRPTIVEVLIVAAIVVLCINLLQPGTVRVSPLCSAASSGDVDEVERLLDRSLADLNERDGRDRTPLHYAASCGQKDTARLLIEKGADIEARDYWKETPLHAAAACGRIEVVRLLVAGGANVNALGTLAGTPLDNAESHAQWLAERDAESKARHKDRPAQMDGNESVVCDEVIKFLIAKGAKRSSALKKEP